MPKNKRAADEVDEPLHVGDKLLSAIDRTISQQFPKLAFTLDENTVLMLDALRRPTLTSRTAMARLIIKEVMDSPESFSVLEFYEQTWRKVYFRSERLKKVVQLLLPREFNVYLRKLSQQVLGTENRSEIFRVVVALYATKKRVVECVSSEVLEFKINGLGSSVDPSR